MSAVATFPEVLGAKELAEALGVNVSNLNSIPGLPRPVTEVAATRLWLVSDVIPFAREYCDRREARKRR